jgi:hypothetical protein
VSTDVFLGRMEGLGATYEHLHAVINGEERVLRYFELNGKRAPVDLGDLKYVTREVVERVCRQLGLDPQLVLSLPN